MIENKLNPRCKHRSRVAKIMMQFLWGEKNLPATPSTRFYENLAVHSDDPTPTSRKSLASIHKISTAVSAITEKGQIISCPKHTMLCKPSDPEAHALPAHATHASRFFMPPSTSHKILRWCRAIGLPPVPAHLHQQHCPYQPVQEADQQHNRMNSLLSSDTITLPCHLPSQPCSPVYAKSGLCELEEGRTLWWRRSSACQNRPWMNLLWKSAERSRTLRTEVTEPSEAFETQLVRKTKVKTYKTKTLKFKKIKDRGKLAHATHASNNDILTVFSLLVILQQNDLQTNTMSRGWEVSFWSFSVKFCKQNWEMLTYHQRLWWKCTVEC